MKLPDLFWPQFSSTWWERHPFSQGEEVMPYIGTFDTEDDTGLVRWYFLGPFAVLCGWVK